MKFLDEYRTADKINYLVDKIHSLSVPECNIMEVCGSQTHTIMKYNLEKLLPNEINLIHGPGCPVCVTPIELIDKAILLASQPDIILTSYGDMLRIPGSSDSLMGARSSGADVRVIYSPIDSIRIANENPGKKIVFFAVGFETTAPANASAVLLASHMNLRNYYILSSQVLIPPAVKKLLGTGLAKLDALLAPGHVCTITGTEWCREVSSEFKIPVSVTGFEPLDILEGVLATARQIIQGSYETTNQYQRVVTSEGNRKAKETAEKVYRICDREWRGLGNIEGSGLKLKDEYLRFNAENLISANPIKSNDNKHCIAGRILQGLNKPKDCLLFGNECTPGKPAGAPMVSSEGACSAYYNYKRSEIIN